MTVSVPAIRLDDALEIAGHRKIHFMAVDVEGAEAACFAAATSPLAAVDPLHRGNEPDSRTPSWRDWEAGVLAARYRLVASDGLNRWYVADEHAELAEVLAEPFNVLDEGLDGWRRVALVGLEQDTRRSLIAGSPTAELLAWERKTAAARVAERDQAPGERDQRAWSGNSRAHGRAWRSIVASPPKR